MLPPDSILQIPFLTEAECSAVVEYAKRKRAELLADPRLGEVGSDIVSLNQPTTVLYGTYCAIKDHPQLPGRLAGILREALPHLAWPVLVQSWVNTYERGEGIKWHNHAGSAHHSYTANVFLAGPTEPGLTVRSADGSTRNVRNSVGTMLLMNCDAHHMVAPNRGDEVRYTMGLTIHDYHALDPVVLSNAAINSTGGSVIIR